MAANGKLCFVTPRLQVRQLKPDDLDGLAALCADEVAMQYMDDGETLDRETCAKWIEICQDKYHDRGYGTSGVFEKASGAFIGFCGVVRPPENDFDEIIYALAQPYWGKGYATEAARGMLHYVFTVSKLVDIYATIDPRNAASIKMMTKLGMHFVEDRPEDDGSITKVYKIDRGDFPPTT